MLELSVGTPPLRIAQRHHASKREVTGACARWLLLLKPTLLERVEAKFGLAPVQWAKFSPVVAALRVAIACYITLQRTLLDRRIRRPKASRHAAIGCSQQRSRGRLLRRNSENSTF
jgi:hypothetical protein